MHEENNHAFVFAVKSLPNEIFTLCDVIIPNETEAEILTGIAVTDLSSAEQAAHALQKLGAKSVIVTLGEKGSSKCARRPARRYKITAQRRLSGRVGRHDDARARRESKGRRYDGRWRFVRRNAGLVRVERRVVGRRVAQSKHRSWRQRHETGHSEILSHNSRTERKNLNE